jgi:asparagine synthase (glutamine-hydrolysing)
MCGICGSVGGAGEGERENVERMVRALAHRGPDDDGIRVGATATLGHRRLTIIDLDQGRQPLSNEDDSIWITYNGEIYNYRELREELIAAGHRFRTHTDTEVIVHLYEELGERCLERLRGMFAFAIWDERSRTLFAARDRFGQKPFFYAERNGRFLFASEIKALLAHSVVRAEPEPSAIDSYLTQRFVPPPLTMFRGIWKLPAGHRLTWRDGTVRIARYWEPDFVAGSPRSDDDWIEELDHRLSSVVEDHMVSDVPVGALLSGGLDSGTVVAIAARSEPGMRTFCIGSDEPDFDETGFARTVAAHCGTQHVEDRVSAAALGEIASLIRCLDEPSDPIAACFHAATRLASRHVKVALGGDGGDEIFAGFDRYAAFGIASGYSKLPRSLREGVVRPILQALPESFRYKSFSQRARWLDALGGLSDGRLYARMTSFFRFGPEARSSLYGPVLAAAARDFDAEGVIADAFDRAPADEPLHRMLYADLLTRLPEHTLVLSDRLSMAHGLELRAPFLDHELAAFCASMPARLKIRRGTTKYALRRAARKMLPASIIERPKQGFMFPVAFWMKPEVLERTRASLLGGPLVAEGWVRAEAIERLIDEHIRRKADHHVRIWMLMSLDVWHREFFGSPVDRVETSEVAEIPSTAEVS